MAKPDTDDGWLMYAHELDAALSAADFTKGARMILRETFAQIFGPAKARSAELLPAVIAERTGLKRSNVYRYIDELTSSNVLKPLAKHHYGFVKDYEKWTKNGQPRLTEAEIEYARKAPEYAMAYKVTGHRGPSTNQQKPCLNPETKPVSNERQNDGCSVSELRQICLNPETDLSQSRDTATIGTRARLETGIQGNAQQAGEPFETPEPEYRPNFHAEPTPEVRAVMDKTERLFDGFGWSSLARAACEEYPPAWVSEAVEIGKAKKAKTWRFIAGILRRFRDQGGPDSVVNKANGPARKAEPQRPEHKPVEVPPGWAEHHARMFGPKAKGKG